MKNSAAFERQEFVRIVSNELSRKYVIGKLIYGVSVWHFFCYTAIFSVIVVLSEGDVRSSASVLTLWCIASLFTYVTLLVLAIADRHRTRVTISRVLAISPRIKRGLIESREAAWEDADPPPLTKPEAVALLSRLRNEV